jgi:hypothetical protein
MAKSKTITEAIEAAEEAAHQMIVKQALQAAPREMKMGDLFAAFEENEYSEQLRALTIGDVLAAVGGGVSKARSTTRQATRTPRVGSGGASKKRNTRTQEGREKIDADIQEALSALGGSARAGDVRAEVGGTPAQVRDSLKRLIDEKLVKTTGQRRATEYHLKG